MSKTILYWQPNLPQARPVRLTVQDDIASAFVRSGTAAAADPSQAGALATGAPLDPGNLVDVALQHGIANQSLRRLSIPMAVALVAAGLGLAAGTSAPIAGTTPFRQWIVDANTRYVVAPHPDYGGIAYQLIYGNGADNSTPPTSIGAPFGGFRITAAYSVATKDTDPTVSGNRTQLYTDVGSIDAAIQLSGGLYGANYHGGITYRSSNVPALAGAFPSFDTGFDADVNFPGGETARVIESMALQSDGSLLKTLSYSSASAFTHVYMSMAIGTGMTQWSNDGVIWNTVAYSGSDVTTPLTAGQLISYMRDPTTGRALRTEIVSFDIGGRTLSRYTVKKSDRLKDYAEFTTGGAPLGTVTITVKHKFYQTVPDAAPTFAAITDTYDGTGSVPSGYAQPTTPTGTQSATLTGGVWQLRAGATPSGSQRFNRPLTGALTDGTTSYRVEIDYTSLSGTGLVMYLKSDNGGSTATSLLPFSLNGAGAATSGNLGSTTAATAVLTFTLPAGSTPYLLFAPSDIAGRGVNITETRITQQ